jgi:hypothetical protein
LSVVAYSKSNPENKVDLTDKIRNGMVTWNSPQKEWTVVMTYAENCPDSYDPMNPLAGKEYIKRFFQRFEDKFPTTSKGNLDFFFSDELNFNLPQFAWNDHFAQEFKQRKGYDIRPYLAALTMDIGKMTTKVRMDYNDVFTALSEENYFKPIFDWNAERGLIIGCDHGGRGYQVDEFGDYFRAQRWNQGPGSDQPHLNKDVVKAKVASSISHLYERQRVWLEGFYSSGWGTTTSALTDAIFSNFAMGYNLLTLHGLYYATPGSLWEWAPPCNHFRMPYWATMDKTLEGTERLSYILSQGYHRCDVAILYPVEPKVAGYGKSASDAAFATGRYLYEKGIDFDFMDYSSLQKCSTNNKELSVAHENYKVVIVPSMQAMKDASLRKLAEFSQHGGIVINIGTLPETTDAFGKDTKHIKPLVETLQKGEKYFQVGRPQEVLPIIDKNLTRDFRVMDANDRIAYFCHRQVDDKNIYGVHNLKRGTQCFFRSTGDAEYWDIWSGKRYKITSARKTDGGTVLNLPASDADFQLIVFSPHSDAQPMPEDKALKTLQLSDEWESEIVPVLDNRFGDYHYPATNEKLGAEIQRYHYKYVPKSSAKDKADIDSCENWNKVTYTYGDEFFGSGATNKYLSDEELSALKTIPENWKPYSYSRRWGVEGDPGHQGYHGIKMVMNPEVIRLGKLAFTATTTFRHPELEGKYYYLFTTVKAPYSGNYQVLALDSCPEDVKYHTRKGEYPTNEYSALPSRCFINGQKTAMAKSMYLHKGINTVVLCYDHPVMTYFFFRDPKQTIAQQKPLALPWYKDASLLPFDPYGSNKGYGWYCFNSAPGLKGFSFQTDALPKVWVNGKQETVTKEGDRCSVSLSTVADRPAKVAICMVLPYGVKGGAAFKSELKQTTGIGIIASGDWGKTDGLETYSGGMKYTQNVQIDRKMMVGKVFLKISDLSSSVIVKVNGHYVDTRVCADWNFDITDFVKQGSNKVELTIYNTASNHYKTIPTQFRGDAPSGMLGKAYICYE